MVELEDHVREEPNVSLIKVIVMKTYKGLDRLQGTSKSLS